MTQSHAIHPPAITEQGQPALEDLIGRLRQPLDMSRVKRRQAPGQGTVPYLEGFDVLEMANDLFQFRWSFDLLGEPQVMRWERQVTIYDQQARKKVPLLGEDGRPVYEPVGICYITGRVQVELGDRLYSHADVGRCVFSGDSPEALDMAIAGAATDCLKRCFRQMGEQFGNGLYDKETARTAGIESEGSNGHGSNGNGRSEKPAAPKPPAPSKPLKLRSRSTGMVLPWRRATPPKWRRSPPSNPPIRGWPRPRAKCCAPGPPAAMGNRNLFNTRR